MSVWVEIDGHIKYFDRPITLNNLRHEILKSTQAEHVYFMLNGKKLCENSVVENGIIHVCQRMLGGKGGFGSMLRAIGAQIEKTTNREACRDLSGRRLRDINEEKRLKNWIAQQAEREREAAERRKKKLEKLCFEPKHDFTDQNYEKERSELTEKVHDAVEKGFHMASSSGSRDVKRKSTKQGNDLAKRRKTCLWVDDIEEDDLSSDDSGSDEELVLKKEKSKDTNSIGKVNCQFPSENKSVKDVINSDSKSNLLCSSGPNDIDTSQKRE